MERLPYVLVLLFVGGVISQLPIPLTKRMILTKYALFLFLIGLCVVITYNPTLGDGYRRAVQSEFERNSRDSGAQLGDRIWKYGEDFVMSRWNVIVDGPQTTFVCSNGLDSEVACAFESDAVKW